MYKRQGVEVKFDSDKSLQINGELIAQGTSSNKITFTSNLSSPAAGDWGGIVFEDESIDAIVSNDLEYISGSIIKSCIVEYAGPGITINHSHPFIEGNIIQFNKQNSGDNVAGGIRLYFAIGDNLIIRKNIIKNNHAESNSGIAGGIRIIKGQNIRIYNNIFISNSAHIYNPNYAYGSSGIHLDNPTGPYYINNNIFSNNSITGIEGSNYNSRIASAVFAEGTTTYINDNLIVNNSAQDANIMGGAITRSSIFQNNNVFNNGSYNFAAIEDNSSAENNYWGTSTDSEIQSLIYDWNDDGSLGFVDYDPYLSTPNTDAPISPPANVAKQASGGNVILTWDANPESDVAGYLSLIHI